MNAKIKIGMHIVSIILFCVGLMGFHVLFEHLQLYGFYTTISFFMWSVNKTLFLDISITLIILAFGMEFLLTFKPIKIIK